MKPPAVAALVFWQAVVKGKTENPYDEIVRVGGEPCNFSEASMPLKASHQRREADGQPDVLKQPAQVFRGVGDALEKVGFAFVKTRENRRRLGLA